jgi:hypothetical protein
VIKYFIHLFSFLGGGKYPVVKGIVKIRGKEGGDEEQRGSFFW